MTSNDFHLTKDEWDEIIPFVIEGALVEIGEGEWIERNKKNF